MYRRGPKGWLKHLDFILLDLLSLQAAFGLAYIIRFVEKDPYADPRLYQAMAIVLLLADIVALFFFNTLKNVLKEGMVPGISHNGAPGDSGRTSGYAVSVLCAEGL